VCPHALEKESKPKRQLQNIKSGKSDKEITVFDSTGLAVQDAVTAELVYKNAIAKKTGHFLTI